MSHYYSNSWNSPVGEITLAIDEEGALVALQFMSPAQLPLRLGVGALITQESTHTAPAMNELQAYFAGELQRFSLKVSPVIGTPYQRRIWAALQNIPYGETWSYARLAAETGSVARAVGSANGANPVAIVVPCHRVIGANGTLVGYAGGLERKRYLLRHEGVETAG